MIIFHLLLSLPLSERRRYCVARRPAVCVCVRVCVCLSVFRATTARRISVGGEGNALYAVLSSLIAVITTRNAF